MNGRTAKLINKVSEDRGEERALKRRWHATPRRFRRRARIMMRQVAQAQWKERD